MDSTDILEYIEKKMDDNNFISQEDIDNLLRPTDDTLSILDPSSKSIVIESLADLEEYLKKREFKKEETYGMFQKNVAVLNFKDNPNSEGILSQIKQKNEKLKIGNIKIPDTKITLINFSYCPECNYVYSFKELMLYYNRPKEINGLKYEQVLRKDTRVCCKKCGTYFIPSLIIDDGTPVNEVQFLCRAQTIDSIEEFYLEKSGEKVLSKNPANIYTEEETKNKRLYNDVYINDLAEKPTLITNIIQYSEPELAIRFVEGKNKEYKDFLYGNPF